MGNSKIKVGERKKRTEQKCCGARNIRVGVKRRRNIRGRQETPDDVECISGKPQSSSDQWPG